jgi:hypothetical protein
MDFGFREADHGRAGELFQGVNEVFTDREVVFDDVCLQSCIHAEPRFL